MREPCTTYTSSRLDYDPFGMLTVGRSWSVGSEYRYGFNTQEQDDEVYGNGNLNTAEFWGYDTRLGRRWNVDPLAATFTWSSPYATYSNNPICRIDPNGKGDYYTKDGKHAGNDKKSDDNKAYVTTQEAIEINTVDGITDWDKVIASSSTKLLDISNTDLLTIAGKVRNETTSSAQNPTDWKEPFAIASALGNSAEIKETDIMDVIGRSLASSNFTIDNNDPYSFLPIAAVINEVTGGFDYSFGAAAWDGGDLFGIGFSQYHPRVQGIDFTPTLYLEYTQFWLTDLPGGSTSNRLMTNNRMNPSNNFTVGIHQATAGSVIGAVMLKSVVVYNGTVFWAPNYNAKLQIPDGKGGYSFEDPNTKVNWKVHL